MVNFFQARLQQFVNQELLDVQAGFRKGRRTRDRIVNICWITVKAREFPQKFTFTSLTAIALYCVDNNKLWKILFFFNVNVLVAIAFVPYTLPFRLCVIKQPGMALDQFSKSTNFTVGSNTNFGGFWGFFVCLFVCLFWLCWASLLCTCFLQLQWVGATC